MHIAIKLLPTLCLSLKTHLYSTSDIKLISQPLNQQGQVIDFDFEHLNNIDFEHGQLIKCNTDLERIKEE